MTARVHLVLFDIDGTLLHSLGAGRRAMRRALEAVYGTAGPIDTYDMAGKTDRHIIEDLLQAAGVPQAEIDARFDAYTRAYERYLEEELQQRPPRALPGTHALIARLSRRHDVVIGLLTGNLVPGARLKLRYAGFDPRLFQVGAFGSDARDRDALPPIALRRAREQIGYPFRGRDVVIVGDTPRDIRCSRTIGAKSVAVATGPYPEDVLHAHGADVVLPHLGHVVTVERHLLDGCR